MALKQTQNAYVDVSRHFVLTLEPSGKAMVSCGNAWVCDGVVENGILRLPSGKIPFDVQTEFQEKVQAAIEKAMTEVPEEE